MKIGMRCKKNSGLFSLRPGANGCERLSHLEGHGGGRCSAGGGAAAW